MSPTPIEWLANVLRYAENHESKTLMMWYGGDYYDPPYYENPNPDHYNAYPDQWFIAPTDIVRAWHNAKTVLELIEANLEAHRIKSGHHKRFSRNP